LEACLSNKHLSYVASILLSYQTLLYFPSYPALYVLTVMLLCAITLSLSSVVPNPLLFFLLSSLSALLTYISSFSTPLTQCLLTGSYGHATFAIHAYLPIKICLQSFTFTYYLVLAILLTYMSFSLYPGPSLVPIHVLTVMLVCSLHTFPYTRTAYNPLLTVLRIFTIFLTYCSVLLFLLSLVVTYLLSYMLSSIVPRPSYSPFYNVCVL
jgi:hypothetical protein